MKKTIFNTVQVTAPKSNVFDLTHDVKLSAKMGNLTPILALECIPGDKFTIAADTLVRLAPLIAPVMHRLDATIHYFFVPNRILWDNWETFIKDEGTGGLPTTNIEEGIYGNDVIKHLDYMGIPPIPAGGTLTTVNSLPLAAYQCIYNEYYRDENLVGEVNYKLTDGDNTSNSELVLPRQRAWEHDYFTAALPFAQKGAEVEIPLGDIALKTNWSTVGIPQMVNNAGNIPGVGTINQQAAPFIDVAGAPGVPAAYDPNGTLQSESATINELRSAFQVQKWLETNARGGTRYIELLRAHFNVVSSDKRLNRPEYITGTKSPIVISEVLNTTGENGGLPQGNMAGHAVSVGEGKKGKYSVEEHGYIIGIMSVLPKPAYQQGIPKNYLKRDPLDFYWPTFAHIGEQEVKNDEIYAYTPNGNETFGYVPRYAEYKYMPSRVAGDFRTTLNYWHLGRIFTSLPTLSQAFIEVDPDDVDRIFAVQDGSDNLYIHVLNKIKAVRKMPVFGTPTI